MQVLATQCQRGPDVAVDQRAAPRVACEDRLRLGQQPLCLLRASAKGSGPCLLDQAGGQHPPEPVAAP